MTAPTLPTGGDPAGRSALVSNYSLAVLVVLQVLSVMDRQILSLMVLPIQADLGLTEIQIGLLQGLAFAILYTTSGLLLGVLIDRYSRRMIIYLGVTVWSLSAGACGFANGFWSLFAGRVGVGVGEAALQPAAYSMLSDLFSRHRLSLAIAVFAMGSNLGVALSFALGGLVVELVTRGGGGFVLPFVGEVKGWQAAFMLTGFPGVLLALLVFTLPEPRRKGRLADSLTVSAQQKNEPLRTFLALRRGVLVSHLIGFPLLATCGYAIAGWTPAFMGRRFGWSPMEIGSALAIALGVGGMIGVLVGGAVVDRLYRRGMKDAHFRVHIITTIVSAPLVIIAFLMTSPWAFLALVMVAFSMLTSFSPAAAAALQIISPNEVRGRLSAMYTFSINMLGLGIGPLAVATATQLVFRDPAKVGASVALVVAVLAPIAALVLAFGLRSYREAILAQEAIEAEQAGNGVSAAA